MHLRVFKIFFLILINLFLLNNSLTAQEWVFRKEKDSIKVYTRTEENNPVKSYRGEMDLHTSMAKISTVLGSIESFDWWDANIHDIKVLAYEKEKLIRYYLVYDLPWPVTDRDLCVEARISNDPITGKRTVHAVPLEGVIPEKPNMVRIKNYWQDWTMQPTGTPGIIHVTLEGSVDPGGYIPAWLVNMVITDTPLNIMRKVREKVEYK
jgi:hypothetical protein